MESINERVQFIVDQYYKGNVTAFSKAVGVTQSTIRDIVKGRMNQPSNETIQKILNVDALKYISAGWLITGIGPRLYDGLNLRGVGASLSNNSGTGVPYYDIDISASIVESFSDVKEEPEFYVDFKPFNDCTAYLPVFGDSMYPLITSGEIVALKKVEHPEYIQYGEPHLIITNAEANNMRTLKIIRKHIDKDLIILKPVNPLFDEMTIPRRTILSLYIVKGKITRRQL